MNTTSTNPKGNTTMTSPKHPALDDLATLTTSDPLRQFDRGRLQYLARSSEVPAIRSTAQHLLKAYPPLSTPDPLPRDPFSTIIRWPKDKRRPLTASEVAFLAEAARRSEDLTLEEALEAAKVAAQADDDGATRLALLATGPRRSEVADDLANRRRTNAAKTRAAMPPKADRLTSNDRGELARAVAKVVAPALDVPDQFREQLAVDVTFERLAAAEAQRDAAYAATLGDLGGDAA